MLHIMSEALQLIEEVQGFLKSSQVITESFPLDFQDWLKEHEVDVLFSKNKQPSYSLQTRRDSYPDRFSPSFSSEDTLYEWWKANLAKITADIVEYNKGRDDFDILNFWTWVDHEEKSIKSSSSKYLESNHAIISMHLVVEPASYTYTIQIMRQDRIENASYARWEKMFYIQQDDAEHTHAQVRSDGATALIEVFDSLRTVADVDKFLQGRGYSLQRETTTPVS